MARRALGRTASFAVVLLLVSFASFVLITLLPGDPTASLLPPGSATTQQVQALRHELNLDRPLPVRYVQWVSRVVHGDLGRSYARDEPVADILWRALVVSAELIVAVQVLAVSLGFMVGTMAAQRAGGRLDRWLQAGVSLAIAAPVFAVSMLLLLVFAVHLHWFPAVGFVHMTDGLWANVRSLVLPSVALGFPLGANYARVVRANMMTVLAGPNITLARAMGYPTRSILVRHALRQTSFNVLTLVGIQLGALLGITVVVEQIFALPGLGRVMIESVGRREYLVVQGGVLIVGGTFAVASLMVDVLHGLLDPRIRVVGVSR